MSSRRTTLVALGAVGAGTLYAVLGRGYPLLLALFLGAAIGAMVFSILRTVDRLRAIESQRSGASPAEPEPKADPAAGDEGV